MKECRHQKIEFFWVHNATVTELAEPLPDYSVHQNVEQLGG